MTWRWTGNEPLFEPMVVYVNDVCMRLDELKADKYQIIICCDTYCVINLYPPLANVSIFLTFKNDSQSSIAINQTITNSEVMKEDCNEQPTYTDAYVQYIAKQNTPPK